MRHTWGKLAVYLLLVAGAIVFSFPFVWMASTSAGVSSTAFPGRGVSETPMASGVSRASTPTSAPSRDRSPSQKATAADTFSGAWRGGGP